MIEWNNFKVDFNELYKLYENRDMKKIIELLIKKIMLVYLNKLN